MFEVITKIFIKLGLFSAIVTAIFLLGAAVDSLIPWGYLIAFFVIVRRFMLFFNWIIDIDTLLRLVGYSFEIGVFSAGFLITRKILHYFNPDVKN